MQRDARLVRDDLLRAQRERRRFRGRQRERLVVAVRVQRLRAAQHGGERLHRDAHDVVERLLRRERDAAGLRVKAQTRARVARAEALAHEARIQAPRRAELGDLLEQVVVRGEEERQPRRERVDAQSGVDRARDVLDRVREA